MATVAHQATPASSDGRDSPQRTGCLDRGRRASGRAGTLPAVSPAITGPGARTSCHPAGARAGPWPGRRAAPRSTTSAARCRRRSPGGPPPVGRGSLEAAPDVLRARGHDHRARDQPGRPRGAGAPPPARRPRRPRRTPPRPRPAAVSAGRRATGGWHPVRCRTSTAAIRPTSCLPGARRSAPVRSRRTGRAARWRGSARRPLPRAAPGRTGRRRRPRAVEPVAPGDGRGVRPHPRGEAESPVQVGHVAVGYRGPAHRVVSPQRRPGPYQPVTRKDDVGIDGGDKVSARVRDAGVPRVTPAPVLRQPDQPDMRDRARRWRPRSRRSHRASRRPPRSPRASPARRGPLWRRSSPRYSPLRCTRSRRS